MLPLEAPSSVPTTGTSRRVDVVARIVVPGVGVGVWSGSGCLRGRPLVGLGIMGGGGSADPYPPPPALLKCDIAGWGMG